eukprot:849300-Pleurochrysis_carterae.AAC.1
MSRILLRRYAHACRGGQCQTWQHQSRPRNVSAMRTRFTLETCTCWRAISCCTAAAMALTSSCAVLMARRGDEDVKQFSHDERVLNYNSRAYDHCLRSPFSALALRSSASLLAATSRHPEMSPDSAHLLDCISYAMILASGH